MKYTITIDTDIDTPALKARAKQFATKAKATSNKIAWGIAFTAFALLAAASIAGFGLLAHHIDWTSITSAQWYNTLGILSGIALFIAINLDHKNLNK